MKVWNFNSLVVCCQLSLMIAIIAPQAAEWPSVETREGAKNFIQNKCFGTKYILLDNGPGTLVGDFYAVRIVFAINKGYGYSIGPFSGNMGIFVKGSQAGTWQIGLDGGWPGPTGTWR
jgi:hypothetical protein